MTGLIIHHGSPNWWLSPDIWVAVAGSPNGSPAIANPVAGTAYDVWVRVTNSTSATIGDWSLFAVWAIPSGGSIPLSALPADSALNETTISVPGSSSKHFKCMTEWTPTYENGGHECLIAWTYDNNIAYPDEPYLEGDAGPGPNWSIAQHNLGVLRGPMRRQFHYRFQMCNGAREERAFTVAARQAPLTEIEAFLPGVPGGRAVFDRPGTFEHLGIVASTQADAAEIAKAPASLSCKIAPRSCRGFTLGGVLPAGNALINVTQSLDQRVVGGLSVLVLADEK